MWGVLEPMSTIVPEVGKYYWVRVYRNDARWRIARRSMSRKAMVAELCWFIFEGDADDGDLEYYDTEINEVGPEIVPPPQ